MIKLLKITVIYLVAIGCKAQSPVINIEDQDGSSLQNVYYKDNNNILNPFEGTYLYTNGSTSFKIILQKKAMVYDGFEFADFLVGEYRYVENGVEKINTLNNLTTTNHMNHNIWGNTVIKLGNPGCQDCTANEKRLRIAIFDRVDNWSGDMILGTLMVGNQQAIKVTIIYDVRTHIAGTVDFPAPNFPAGEYVLIKQ